jgi:hypothetical protein
VRCVVPWVLGFWAASLLHCLLLHFLQLWNIRVPSSILFSIWYVSGFTLFQLLFWWSLAWALGWYLVFSRGLLRNRCKFGLYWFGCCRSVGSLQVLVLLLWQTVQYQRFLCCFPGVFHWFSILVARYTMHLTS